MAYVAPGIDANGIHVPEYTDILDRLIEKFRSIFGDDLYLGDDTQDYQMIAEFADLMDDVGAVLAENYASRNPNFASGVSLDYLVALNGLRRMLATYSTATVTASGTEGTQIPAGSRIMDANGNQWATVADATIGSGGTVSISVKAAVAGHINAEAGSITQIMSPTAGWVSVTNALPAVAGRDVETDAELRERRFSSVSTNGRSILESIVGSLRALDGVQKVRVYENSGTTTDSNGIPAKSICAIVLGGLAQSIADTIRKKKSPGCGTYGSTSETSTDIYGNNYTINFSRPVDTTIKVNVTVKTFSGYNSETADTIKRNIIDYIDSIQIGEDLNVGMLWSCILSVNTDMSKPICTPVSVTAAIGSGQQQSGTVETDYNANMVSVASDITITVQS